MKKNKGQSGKLWRLIGLYLLCLLAAFLTWIAVMYTEEKSAAEPEKEEEVISLYFYDDGMDYVAAPARGAVL